MVRAFETLGSSAYSGPFSAQSGRLGNSNQLVRLLDAEKGFPIVGRAGERPAPSPDEASAVRAFLESRTARLRAHRGRFGQNKRRLDDFLASLQTRERLGDFSGAFGEVAPALAFSQQIDIALDMIAQEVTWSVSLDTGLDWDTHTNSHVDQMANNIALFDGLSQLVDGLKARPGSMGGRLIDETAVVVISEMGRTPTLNAEQGKDHWQVTSAMVIGSDVAGDRAFGASTETGAPEGVLQAAPVDFATGAANGAGQLVESAQFVAGVLGWVGSDPARFLPGVTPFMPWVG